uniref:BACH transcription regulator protein n=1 Tax=Phallusia mammillata TaxID=59560 RepID=A0A6F9D6V6_9ASCI|nr:BACH transcription regulator protein [Phallusia mammillata]
MSATPAEVTVIVSHTSTSGTNTGHSEVQPQYVYESNIHAQNVLATLNEQRKKGLLCDMTVIVDGIELQAHKAVLAACSSYFNGIITDPANVSHNIVLELSSISRIGMENILEFAYTSKLTVCRSNIDHVLAAARELDVKNLEYACLNLLKEKLLQESTDCVMSQCPEGANACRNSTISRKVLPQPAYERPANPEKTEIKDNTKNCCVEEKSEKPKVGCSPQKADPCSNPATWKGDCPLMAQLSLESKPQLTVPDTTNKFCPTQHVLNTSAGAVPVKCDPAQEGMYSAQHQAFLQQFLQHQRLKVADSRQCDRGSASAMSSTSKLICSTYNSDTDEALSADEDQDKYKCPQMMNMCKGKKQNDVVLPFSIDDITKLPRNELHELLSKHPNLNLQQINAVHEIRRRGKNRIAAQRCRKRKMDCIRALQYELEHLHKSHSELMQERRCVREGALQLAELFRMRCQQVFDIKSKICRMECKDLSEGKTESSSAEGGECTEKPPDHIIASMAEYFKNESECAKQLAERLTKIPCENLPPLSCTLGSSTEVVVVCDEDENPTSVCYKPCSPSMCSTTSYSSTDGQIDLCNFPSISSECIKTTNLSEPVVPAQDKMEARRPVEAEAMETNCSTGSPYPPMQPG